MVTTIDEFVDPVASARTTPMALRPGAIRAEWVQVDLGRVLVEIGDYSFAIATRGETMLDRVVILTPLHRSASGHLNGEPLVPGVLHAWGEGAEVAGATTGPMRFGIVSFGRRTLDQSAQALGIELDLPCRGGFRAVRAADCVLLADAFDTVQRMAANDGIATPSERSTTDLSAALLELSVRCFAAEDDGAPPTARARLNSVRMRGPVRTAPSRCDIRASRSLTFAVRPVHRSAGCEMRSMNAMGCPQWPTCASPPFMECAGPC